LMVPVRIEDGLTVDKVIERVLFAMLAHMESIKSLRLGAGHADCRR
jgi:hypothetical protein